MAPEQPLGESQPIPPVEVPKASLGWLWRSEPDERGQLEKDGSQRHNVRRVAAYGGIFFAGLLYLAGLGAIGLFLGLLPPHKPATADMWHIVVAVLVALFTVPTVLVIAVLRVTGPQADESLPPTAHEALGKMIEKILDKACG